MRLSTCLLYVYKRQSLEALLAPDDVRPSCGKSSGSTCRREDKTLGAPVPVPEFQALLEVG